jgi:hypothetical protein
MRLESPAGERVHHAPLVRIEARWSPPHPVRRRQPRATYTGEAAHDATVARLSPAIFIVDERAFIDERRALMADESSSTRRLTART